MIPEPSPQTPAPEPERWPADALLQRLVDGTLAWLATEPLALADLCLGVSVSWVLVTDGTGRQALGTALTPAGEGTLDGSWFTDRDPDWCNWSLADLPPLLLSDHPLERCLGLAAINAVSQFRLAREGLAGTTPTTGRAGLVQWIADQAPRRLVMIGNMHPLVEGLAKYGIVPRVFERSPGNRAGALPDAQEWAWLGAADGLIITGATLLNHTLAPLLALSAAARFRVLVGFSAQAHPRLFAGSGLTAVFSMHALEPERMRRRLQLGHWNVLPTEAPSYLAAIDPTAPSAGGTEAPPVTRSLAHG